MINKSRAFRFGFLTGGAASRKAWIDKARRAEDLGYATLLIDDHLQNRFAPLTALVSAADATTSLRVGSFVFGNDFRHPVVLAKEAATLDMLTDGRFELGLGTGYAQADYEKSGLTLGSPGTRVSRFEEAVQVIKGLFAEDPFTYVGELLQDPGTEWAAEASSKAPSSPPPGRRQQTDFVLCGAGSEHCRN